MASLHQYFRKISSTVTEPGIGSSFMAEAVIERRLDVLRVLPNTETYLNKTWQNGWPALHAAVICGSRAIDEILVNLMHINI
jgi:hypothetical protein